MAAAAAMPFIISNATAGEKESGMSGLAQREIIRRQEAVAAADRLFLEGREAYAKVDYQTSVDKFKQALDTLPQAPTLDDRRASYTQHLADASVALAQHFRKVGKYDEARALLDGVLSPKVDPDNAAAKAELGYLDDPIRTNPALTYEHTKNIDEVRRALYMAQGNYDIGKFDAAKVNYDAVLRIDPYNQAARRGMEKIAAAKSDYYRAAYDQTRSQLLMEVDAAWELSVPAELPISPTGTGDGPSLPEGGVAYITEKLRRIVIPSINFDEGTSLEEAIDFLRMRAAELDTLELDPDRKGINLIIQRPRSTGLGGGELDAAAGADADAGELGSLRLENALRLRNVPLATALGYITEQTKLRYKVDDYAVTLVPQTDTGEDLFTRTFRVRPDFQTVLSAGTEGAGAVEADPFAADAGGGARNMLQPRPPVIELLKKSGILFGDGSSATLNASGTLLVVNTPAELDKVDQLIESMDTGTPKQVKITTKFVEIAQENNDELGFDWVINPFGLNDNSNLFGTGGTVGNGTQRGPLDFVSPIDGNAQPRNIVTSGLRSGDAAIDRNSIDAILNNPNRTAQSANVAPGIIGVSGFFNDFQFSMMMRGLAQKKGTDLMTAPSVTARSGQKATIEVIREFIYPTEYEAPQLPTSVGAPSAIGGLPGGGLGGGGFPVTPATPTAFETRNTGVTLEIEPTIGENDFVIDLRFLPEIVEFEGFINYGSPILAPSTDALGNPVNSVITENRIEMPVFAKRSVNTSITIYDGYTVAVGGLMREDVQSVEDSVPILGDIPIIGRLFQSKSDNRIKSNIIIFVTAQIIDATGRPLRGNDSNNVPVTAPVPGLDGTVLQPLEEMPAAE